MKSGTLPLLGNKNTILCHIFAALNCSARQKKTAECEFMRASNYSTTGKTNERSQLTLNKGVLF